MKRNNMLLANIFGIASCFLTFVGAIVCLCTVPAVVEEFIGTTTVAEEAYFVEMFLYIFYIIILATAVVGVIFNVLTIDVWNKSTEVFKSKKAKIIVALIFNFAVAELAVVVWGVFGLLTMGLLISAGVLMLVTLIKEKKAYAVDQEIISEIKKEIAQTEAEDEFERKLTKLNEMRQSGIINEEEYQAIKSKYINERFGV